MQRAGEVNTEEHVGGAMAADSAVARALPLDGGMDDGICPVDQLARSSRIAQLPRQPLDRGGF